MQKFTAKENFYIKFFCSAAELAEYKRIYYKVLNGFNLRHVEVKFFDNLYSRFIPEGSEFIFLTKRKNMYAFEFNGKEVWVDKEILQYFSTSSASAVDLKIARKTEIARNKIKLEKFHHLDELITSTSRKINEVLSLKKELKYEERNLEKYERYEITEPKKILNRNNNLLSYFVKIHS